MAGNAVSKRKGRSAAQNLGEEPDCRREEGMGGWFKK